MRCTAAPLANRFGLHPAGWQKVGGGQQRQEKRLVATLIHPDPNNAGTCASAVTVYADKRQLAVRSFRAFGTKGGAFLTNHPSFDQPDILLGYRWLSKWYLLPTQICTLVPLYLNLRNSALAQSRASIAFEYFPDLFTTICLKLQHSSPGESKQRECVCLPRSKNV